MIERGTVLGIVCRLAAAEAWDSRSLGLVAVETGS